MDWHLAFCGQANDDSPTQNSAAYVPNGGMKLAKTATSLRPHIVQVMATHQGRILTTEEIYQLVAGLGVDGFNPRAKRDRNLINRELSDLAGRTTQGHSKPSPQLIIRMSRGHYVYREPDRPMDVALLQEYLEPVEVYEKRPPRRRRGGSDRRDVPERSDGLVRGAAGRVPWLRVPLDADHIVALTDDGKDEVHNLQLLCN